MAVALVSPAAVAADVEVVAAAAGGVRTSASSKTSFR
jgi:hypothetical protein